MPNVFINFDTATAGVTGSLAGDANAIGIVSADATAVSYTSSVLSGWGSGQNVTVAGAALSNNAFTIGLSGADATVNVTQSGQVTNTNTTNTAAVNMGGLGATVINQGLISGGTGVQLNQGATASGTPSQVINHGVISGNGLGYPGDMYSTASYGAGVYIDGGIYDPLQPDVPRDPVNIVNTGTISGAYRDGVAPGYSILLQSDEFIGLDEVEESEYSNIRVQVINSGTLMGSVQVLSQNDVVENSGLIHGDVMMGLGADRVDSHDGRVHGTVMGEGGNDTLIGGEYNDDLSGGDGNDDLFSGGGDDFLIGGNGNDEIRAGDGEDTVAGNDGDDVIRGGDNEDRLFGGGDNDTLAGNNGDDYLRGGTGDDFVYGGSGQDDMGGGSGNDYLDGGLGDDIIRGNDDNDTILGGRGEDTLAGQAGDDILVGGADNDRLIAGTGQDTLTGGTGADVFVWTSELESPLLTRDQITDFEDGVDMIDLSDIASGLTFVAAYTGTAGEVRYNDSLGRLYIDVDGDSSSDFAIDVTGAPTIDATDLIL